MWMAWVGDHERGEWVKGVMRDHVKSEGVGDHEGMGKGYRIISHLSNQILSHPNTSYHIIISVMLCHVFNCLDGHVIVSTHIKGWHIWFECFLHPHPIQVTFTFTVTSTFKLTSTFRKPNQICPGSHSTHTRIGTQSLHQWVCQNVEWELTSQSQEVNSEDGTEVKSSNHSMPQNQRSRD